jgi:hypothetical protein
MGEGDTEADDDRIEGGAERARAVSTSTQCARRRLGIGQSFAQILWGRRTRRDDGLLDFRPTPIGALPISGDDASAPGMLEPRKVGPPCLAEKTRTTDSLGVPAGPRRGLGP